MFYRKKYMSAKPPKIGRPKLPRGEARSNGLHIRLTRLERLAVDNKAKEQGQQTSDWSRKILLAATQS